MQSPRLMTATIVSMLALSLNVSANAETSSRKSEPARKTGWHSSFSQAQAEAKAAGKPLLIHFYTEWCGPCKQMERTVLHQPGVVSRLGIDVIAVKVDADQHPDIKSRYGVSGFPTDVVLSPDGEVSTRYVGVTTESGFIARLKSESAKVPSGEETQVAGKNSKADPKDQAVETGESNPEEEHLGLDGYSPVALTAKKLWKKGKPEFAANYRGMTFRFLNEEGLKLFLANPAEYAPQLLGCDPVIMAESGRAVPGKTSLGVFFRESVFLMSTEDNRNAFLKNPAYYADKRFAVEAEEIEQFVSR